MMPNRRAARKTNGRNRRTLREILSTKTAQTVIVMIVGVVLLCVLMTIAIAPKRYNLRVGEISYTTITATKDVVDEVSTARQREEAASKVEPSYVFNETVTTDVVTNLDAVLKQVNAVQQYGRNILEQQYPGDTAAQQAYLFNEAELSYAQGQLTQLTLAGYQLQTLLHATDQQMLDMTNDLTAAVENTMNTTIREGYVSETIQYLQQIVGYKTDIDLLQNVVTPILRKVIQPNMLIDQTATEALREEARKAVEPVIYKQGQNIVLARERVTYNQLEMLRSLGLLDSDDVDVMMYVSGILMVFIAIGILVMVLMMLSPELLRRPSRMLIIMLAMCLTLGVCVLAKLINVYLMPSLLCVVMLTSLLGARAGMAACLSITVIVGTLATGSESTFSAQTVNIILTTLISGLTALMIVRRKPNRQQILLCGIITLLVNAALILVVGFMTNTSLHEVASDAIWSAASAAVAAILTIAFDPLVEAMFNLATPTKLMELSNPNHPLLRRLLIEASGTYHHSIIVANLAEAAAESVGANQLLARAGAYFHDIGKLKRPLYFKENQIGDNPHEHTNPYVSAAIVTAHTRDGLVLAQQYRLPQEIQNIIVQHHGDTPVMYFYHKASQEAGDAGVDIADFRYDGKRPQTKESAIIMLADTVEAAVRSMANPTPKAIEDFIRKLVQGKLDDGQLNEAPLTLLDVERICQAFTTVLKGVFHERIEYPSISPTAAARVNASLMAGDEPHTESRVEAKELRRADAPEGEGAAPPQPKSAQGGQPVQPAPKPTADPAAVQSAPKPTADPVAVQSAPKPTADPVAVQSAPKPTADHGVAQPAPKPAADSVAVQPAPKPTADSATAQPAPKPAADSVAVQPAPKPAADPSAVQAAPKPTADSATAQPAPKPTADHGVAQIPAQPTHSAQPCHASLSAQVVHPVQTMVAKPTTEASAVQPPAAPSQGCQQARPAQSVQTGSSAQSCQQARPMQPTAQPVQMVHQAVSQPVQVKTAVEASCGQPASASVSKPVAEAVKPVVRPMVEPEEPIAAPAVIPNTENMERAETTPAASEQGENHED